MTQYRTADGRTFADENRAIAHAQAIDFQRNGGFPEFGKPYDFSRIDRIDEAGNIIERRA